MPKYETEITEFTMSPDHLKAVVKFELAIRSSDYDLWSVRAEIQQRIVDHMVNEFISKHGVEVMKGIDVSAIINLVSLKAAKIIKE
jgi:hypothetical protein